MSVAQGRMACSRSPINVVAELIIEPYDLDTQCVSASMIWAAEICQKRKFERRYIFTMFITIF